LIKSGTPAAFSGICSEQHLPGFFSRLSEFRQKGIQNFYVIAVNDPFVMNAWKDSLGADSSVSLL
jgi:peroxiredoxin